MLLERQDFAAKSTKNVATTFLEKDGTLIRLHFVSLANLFAGFASNDWKE